MISTKYFFNLLVIILLVLLNMGCQSNSKNSPATITMKGKATIVINPDHVVVMIGIDATKTDARAAQTETMKKVKKILGFIAELGISDRDVSTDYLTLEKEDVDLKDEGNKRQDLPPKYEASMDVRIVLRDLAKFEQLIQGLMLNGVNRIDGITFDSTERVAKTREARIQAIRAAKEKAIYLANAINETVGKALVIEEINRNYSNSATSNTFSIEGISLSDNRIKSFSPKSLLIESEIKVVFELLK
jgi:uncharacterized protein YggE